MPIYPNPHDIDDHLGYRYTLVCIHCPSGSARHLTSPITAPCISEQQFWRAIAHIDAFRRLRHVPTPIPLLSARVDIPSTEIAFSDQFPSYRACLASRYPPQTKIRPMRALTQPHPLKPSSYPASWSISVLHSLGRHDIFHRILHVQTIFASIEIHPLPHVIRIDQELVGQVRQIFRHSHNPL